MFLWVSSATKLKCNIICCYVVAKGGCEGGGGSEGGVVDNGKQGLEGCRGGIHALGLATISRSGRGGRKVCMAGNCWSEGMKRKGEAGKEETIPKREGGASKYNDYNEQRKESVYTVLAFFLFVFLRVGSMNTGRPYFDNF